MMKPDWSLWPGCRNVRLDDAVWLSIEIDPDYPIGLETLVANKLYTPGNVRERTHKFNRRFAAAKGCWGTGEAYPKDRRAVDYDMSVENGCLIVNLGKFGTFCDIKKWNIPDEFPRDESLITELDAAKAKIADLERQLDEVRAELEAARIDNAKLDQSTVAGTYADLPPRLVSMIEAYGKFWRPVDKDERDTYTETDCIEKWFTERGFSETRIAPAAATIIRPEWAKSGRPPKNGDTI